MAIEPVASGEKVTVGDNEGVVVRSVGMRGGVEYTVRVGDPDAPASQPVKLPQGYDPVAAYGTAEQAEVHRQNAEQDKREREELDKALADERQAYVDKENELTEKLVDANDDEEFNPSTVSHVTSAEAARQVDEERAEKRRGSKVDGEKMAQKQDEPEEKLRETKGTKGPDEHGSNLLDQANRAATAPGAPRSQTDPKPATEGKRNR